MTVRYVTFLTTASEVEINGTLVQTGNNTGTDERIGNAEVYLYDRLNDTLRMVSVAPDNTPGDATAASLKTQSDDSEWPASMSADGRYIVFSSTASILRGCWRRRSRRIQYFPVRHADRHDHRDHPRR